MQTNTDNRISIWVFWIIVSLIYSAIYTTIDFSDNPFSGIQGFITLFAQASVVAVAASGIIGLIAINRIVFAITFPLLILLSSILSYFHLTLGVALSAANIELMMVNNVSIWLTLVSSRLVLIMMTSLTIAIFVTVLRWKYVVIRRPMAFFVLNLCIVCTPTLFVHRLYAPVSHRMPYCFYFAFKDYISNRKEIRTKRTAFNNITVTKGDNAPDVVIILGESLRSDHLSFNGYYRQTTPRLQRDSSIISYPNLHTHLLATHQNIPYLLTRADSIHDDRANLEESFITLFEKAGYNSYWVSNQDKNPTYAYFMNETDSTVLVSPGWTTHNFIEAHDQDMMPYISNFLNNKTEAPQLLIIHSMGSHWVYNLSHPKSFAKFKPEVNSRVLSELSIEQLNNSYDNTILATDDFISDVISLLRKRNAVLIYVSDHGENLGENGLYLHNQPSEYVFNPACFFWYSTKYASFFPQKIHNLKINASKLWRNDIIFHTVLDAANLDTEILVRDLSVMNPHKL